MDTSEAGGRTPRRGRRIALAGGAVAALAVAGLVASTLGGSPDDQAGDPGAPVDLGPVQRVALQSFSSCDALLTYYRGHARRLVTEYGLGGGPMWYATGLAAESARAADSSSKIAAPAPAAAGGDTGATSQSGTNVQVAGVDEADVAKLSGDLLITLNEGRLNVLRVSGRTVTRAGQLNLAPQPDPRQLPGDVTDEKRAQFAPSSPFMPQQLLVHENRAIAIGQLAEVYPAGATKIADLMPAMSLRTRLAEVDLTDPAKPRLVRTADVDGSVVGARLVAGVLRLAVTNPPSGITWSLPTPARDGSIPQSSQARALAANRRAVAAAGLDAWLPNYRVTDFDAAGKGTPGGGGRLVGCEDVASPQQFSGIDTLSLVSADLEGAGIGDLRGSGVVAQGATVYATPQDTYVATAAWQDPTAKGASQAWRPGAEETAVHQFATEDRTGSRYVASGRVPGTLLNQFAMDEHEGVLRVATTTQGTGTRGVEDAPATDPDTATSSGDGTSSSGDIGSGTVPARPVAPSPRPSESRVTTLRQQGKALVQVGVVGGLGRTEQIRSVRFIGDLGYVVTFRQTDPLYTIDLSDPAKPEVAGELKILGYSAYLHPAGPGRLLGVGQDADDEGRTTGLQLSLFDISDPAAPKRIDAAGVGQAWTEVEGDHHAFTFADGLALAPYSRWWQPDPARPTGMYDAGVLAVRVAGGSLGEPRTLRPLADAPVSESSPGATSAELQKVQAAQPLRTFVRGGAVYTVTATGVAVHDAQSLGRLAFTPYER